ncbi:MULTISPECIES: SagB family peptide dehydrogenase [Aerosakkonema]|uniref:SagB family peptide dehydrogenase n=1 Tax=Aerosakkonema TaxID=1246629 RepID=UPI0035B94E83
MPPSFVLSFKKNISVIEQLKKYTGSFSPGLQTAIGILCEAGDTEKKLADLVLEKDGFPGLTKFHYYLKQFITLGLICHTIYIDEIPLIQVIPYGENYKFQFKNPNPDKKYVLSRFAYLHGDKEQIIIESPLSHSQIILNDWRTVVIIHELARPQYSSEISGNIPGLPEEITQIFLGILLSNKAILELEAYCQNQEENEALNHWEFHDLLFHSRSRTGRHDTPSGKNNRFLGKIKPTNAIKKSLYDEQINLYQPELENLKQIDSPFTFILEERKSLRSYANKPISARQLGEFLYRSVRVKEVFIKENMEYSNRPYPSGGASYELEFYTLINNCEDVPPGLYHYCPINHQLGKICELNIPVIRLLKEAEMATGEECNPQVLIVITARFARVMWSYQSIAYALILKHVGIVMQTMYLVATGMNLAPCALGGGNSDLFALATGIDYYAESSVGEFILGSKKIDEQDYQH